MTATKKSKLTPIRLAAMEARAADRRTLFCNVYLKALNYAREIGHEIGENRDQHANESAVRAVKAFDENA